MDPPKRSLDDRKLPVLIALDRPGREFVLLGSGCRRPRGSSGATGSVPCTIVVVRVWATIFGECRRVVPTARTSDMHSRPESDQYNKRGTGKSSRRSWDESPGKIHPGFFSGASRRPPLIVCWPAPDTSSLRLDLAFKCAGVFPESGIPQTVPVFSSPLVFCLEIGDRGTLGLSGVGAPSRPRSEVLAY